ncbi:hypothetical protein Syun_023132 [Stephania yunnanensis]|uniref:Uncharacterized protein n=1 Tax=Stephania yunnanensis TaxID=152371 RepID=A0AAP0F8D8_9MAGN
MVSSSNKNQLPHPLPPLTPNTSTHSPHSLPPLTPNTSTHSLSSQCFSFLSHSQSLTVSLSHSPHPLSPPDCSLPLLSAHLSHSRASLPRLTTAASALAGDRTRDAGGSRQPEVRSPFGWPRPSRRRKSRGGEEGRRRSHTLSLSREHSDTLPLLTVCSPSAHGFSSLSLCFCCLFVTLVTCACGCRDKDRPWATSGDPPESKTSRNNPPHGPCKVFVVYIQQTRFLLGVDPLAGNDPHWRRHRRTTRTGTCRGPHQNSYVGPTTLKVTKNSFIGAKEPIFHVMCTLEARRKPPSPAVLPVEPRPLKVVEVSLNIS